jgi:tRNA U34 2-thiouridine synthase MnmA/TrmU
MQVRGVYFDLIGAEISQEKINALERKLGISIQVVPAQVDFANQLTRAKEIALEGGEILNSNLFFHHSYLFPKLLELKEQHGFDQLATGHRVLIQEDLVSNVFRIFQNADLDFSEVPYLLGRSQKELRAFLLPLGSIPSSMFQKLSLELDQTGNAGALITWKNDFKETPSSVDVSFDVYTKAGVRMGSHKSAKLPQAGDFYRTPEKVDAVFRIIEVSFHNRSMIIIPDAELKIEEVHFQDAAWFSQDDLGLLSLECEMISEKHPKPISARLLQYEGGRVKAFMNQQLRHAEANIFKGQTVLWVKGAEILGGGRVLGTR